MSSPIGIMLADSNPLVLSAMSEIFEKDRRFSVLATSATAEGFLSTFMRLPSQVAVVEWKLPTLGASRLIEVLREQENPPKIVVFDDSNGDLPRLAMMAGAAGFAARSGNVDGLLQTCVEVAEGKMVFPYVDVRDLRDDPIMTLSKKERQVLEALSLGLTNKELATELGISTNTVKFHLSNLYEKLSVRNRAQAIAFCYSSGIAREAALARGK